MDEREVKYIKAFFKDRVQKFIKPSASIMKSIVNRSKISLLALNNEPLNIHFLNGYWSLEDHTFHNRTEVHYMTKIINYDLDENNNEDLLNSVNAALSLLFSSQEALRYFVHSIALSLKNIPTNNFLVLLGPGSNGKTAFTSILRAVFECYCVSLPSACLDTIVDANKAMNDIKNDTLFVFIDEIQANANKKSSLIKKLSDGYVMYNRLYQSGSYEMSTRAKLIINSNHPLSFDDDDEAIRNRILYLKFTKKFSTSVSEVDNVTVFQAFANISSKLTSSQKSAIFMYFAIYVKNMDINAHLDIPDDVLTKNKLVNWKDFVHKHFQLNNDGFVSKELVFRLFKETYPDFEYKTREIIKALSELPAEYNVSYERLKVDGENVGRFKGLYSVHEQDNIKPKRDLAYEAMMINSTKNNHKGAHVVQSVDLDFNMADDYGDINFDE